VYPSEARFREIYDTLEPYIERKYGIPVVISDVKNPFTGDLDGAEIRVDYDQPVEEAVFIIAHLFGHTVQWNLSAEARDIGYRVQQNPTDEQMKALHEYEKIACRYSLTLFRDVGVKDADQWLADFAACDFAFLADFYKSGEKKPFRSFWKNDQPLLEPLAIPEFHPTRWVSRWQGIVV
jgi:hypothetical protein